MEAEFDKLKEEFEKMDDIFKSLTDVLEQTSSALQKIDDIEDSHKKAVELEKIKKSLSSIKK